MSDAQGWTVKRQDTADGSGDVIVDLPSELLTQLGAGVGGDCNSTRRNPPN